VVGVVGFGRIGVLVAQRLSAFGVQLIAYDPFVQPARAAQLGVRMVELDELLATSDFITVHLPKTPETLGLIGEEALRKVKPTVRIINAARGGIVDELALHVAISEGRVAGAGLDVYAKEPCTDSPLFAHDSVVATPHLGASTDEAQEKAGIAVAKSVRLALEGELVPDAVNVQGGALAETVKPLLPLAEQLGAIASHLSTSPIERVDVEVLGEVAHEDVRVVELSALKGIFAALVDDPISYVNAPVIAKARGVEVSLSADAESPDHRSMVRVRTTLTDGQIVAVAGTVAGARHATKLVQVDGFDLDVAITEHMAFLGYVDRPGVVGTMGRILGERGINIAGMQVGRTGAGGDALTVLTVDSAIPAATMEEIVDAIGAGFGRAVDLA
jgi:D-3-phosphoglycerate dehydrogenase